MDGNEEKKAGVSNTAPKQKELSTSERANVVLGVTNYETVDLSGRKPVNLQWARLDYISINGQRLPPSCPLYRLPDEDDVEFEVRRKATIDRINERRKDRVSKVRDAKAKRQSDNSDSIRSLLAGISKLVSDRK